MNKIKLISEKSEDAKFAASSISEQINNWICLECNHLNINIISASTSGGRDGWICTILYTETNGGE